MRQAKLQIELFLLALEGLASLALLTGKYVIKLIKEGRKQ